MILMAGWPRQPTDADTLFARSLERIFAEYPPSVTKAISDPLTGMQRSAAYEKFPPTIPQIVKELNREMEIFRRNAMKHQARRIEAEQPEKPPLDLEKYPEFFGRKTALAPGADSFHPLPRIPFACGDTAEQLRASPALEAALVASGHRLPR